MVQTADMEDALRRLHIKYRGKRFPDSVLYLCDAPGQITFNLECGKEDVHLWRFLPVDIPDGHAGEKIEKAGNGSVAGLEITEDNILNFYIRKGIRSPDDRGCAELLGETIAGFLRESVRIQEHFRSLVYA